MKLLVGLLICYTSTVFSLIHSDLQATPNDVTLLKALSQLIVDVYNNHQIVFLTTTELYFRLGDSFNKVFTPENSHYFYIIQDEAIFPMEYIQRSNCVAVVLVENENHSWLNGDIIPYTYESSIIVAFNQEDIGRMLNFKAIRKSINIYFLQGSKNGLDENIVNLYTLPHFRSIEDNPKAIIGYFWNEQWFDIRSPDIPQSKFNNFQGSVLKIASDLDDFPLIYIDSNNNIDGMNVRILKSIGQVLNFSCNYSIEAKDGFWGEKINGTWNGLLGMIHDQDYILTINYFPVFIERMEDFDVSCPYFIEGFGFALPLPAPLPPWLNLIYLFHFHSWLLVIATIILASILLFSFNTLIPWTKEKKPASKSIVIVLQGLFKQSIPKIPDKTGYKLFLGIWWIGCFLITVYYTGNLIAVLTIPILPPKIESLEQLAESNLRISMIDYGEFLPEALLNSQKINLRRLGEKMDLLPMLDKDTGTYGPDLLIDAVLSRKYAIIESYSYLRNLVSQHKEAGKTSYILKQQIYSAPLVFYFKKYTIWIQEFNKYLQRLVEAGLINKWYYDIMHTRKDIPEMKPVPLKLYHLQGAFIILIIGWIVAFLVLTIEQTVHLGRMLKNRVARTK